MSEKARMISIINLEKESFYNRWDHMSIKIYIKKW